MTPGTIWLAVHGAVAIVSASLPTFRPLLGWIPGVNLGTTQGRSYYESYGGQNTHTEHSKRTEPTAAANVTAASKELRNSSDESSFARIAPGVLHRASESTAAESPERDIELHNVRDSTNGVTRMISVATPTTDQGKWGQATVESHSHPEWPLEDDSRPATKRADFELTNNRREEAF